MTKQAGIILGIVVALGIALFWFFSTMIGLKNEEATLRVRIKKQTEVCSIRFDDMWKIIKKKASVPEHYKNDFKDLILADNTTTYGDKGLQINGFMSTIQKTNPTFTPEMYKELMQTIEGEMKSFEIEQKNLIALSEQHEILITTFPGTLFLSGIQPIEIKLVTSGKTKKAYETGEDNDTDVFGDEDKKVETDTTKKK